MLAGEKLTRLESWKACPQARRLRVYKIKYNVSGEIERHKTLLVIFGNHEVVGIKYNEIFSLVAKMVTVRTFLVVATIKNWKLIISNGCSLL